MCNALTHFSRVWCESLRVKGKYDFVSSTKATHDYMLVWRTRNDTVYDPTLGNYLDLHVQDNCIIDEAKWAGRVDVQRPTLSVIFKLSPLPGMSCDLRVPWKLRLITKAVSLPKAYEI